MKELQFKVLSQKAELYKIFEHLTQLGKEVNYSTVDMLDIKLCVDEAFVNILKHSYENKPDGEVIFFIKSYDDKIEITIRDFGKKADPEVIKPRDLNDLKPNGLGVLLIQRLMDEVTYNFSNNDFNELKLKKYLKPSQVR